MKPKSQNTSPPKWAVRFFRWYCNDHLSEAVLGDMEELYERRQLKMGKRKADFLFLWNVLLFLQPFAIRKESKSTTYNTIAMLENYFKITWRTMSRQKMYAAIKIGGFAIGLAACMIIFLFIRNEVSYDKRFAGSSIFRMYNDFGGTTPAKWTSLPPSVAQIVKNDFPEIEKTARLIPQKWFNAGSNLFRRDDRTENAYEEGFAYADNDLLEILEIPMVYGSKQTALAKQNSIVISKRIADKYFPNEDPTGKIIILNENKTRPFVIGGVMEDFPENSHIHFDFFITLSGKEFWPGEQTDWCCWNYDTYIQLRPDASPEALQKKLISVRDNYLIPYLKKNGDQSVSDIKQYHAFGLQPVQDIYLNTGGVQDELRHGDSRYVWLFGGIAVFILILAGINFINLTTAKSANRSKEVGLRKVVGSGRGYLIRQFLSESIVYSFISFAIGIMIVVLALPFFNTLSGKQLFIPWATWWWVPMLAGAVIIIGVLAGIYPAFYLSSFKPADVLKGSTSLGSKSSKLRSAMVVFQFTTSIILIIGTFVVYRQMNYILTTKIGFDKEQVIMIEGANTLDKQQLTFKNELLQLSSVKSVTISDYLPVNGTTRDQNGFWREGKTKEEKGVYGQKWIVDEDYIPTLGMKLTEGRNFDIKLASDSQAIIINQAMVKEFGFKNPIGERITNNNGNYTVIGVLENFNYESMKGQIRSLCFVMERGGSIVSVKVKSASIAEDIQSLNKMWNKFMPNQPFRYSFLDERYARMYEDVDRMGNIFAGFALLAIMVACLGLFALSAFMVEQRSKEISIRLVMGASVKSIFRLLTQNFVTLVLISFAIATPVSWYMMQRWLEDYTYKITITWDVFILAGLISVVIALLTVSYQSITAALANPADKLRSE